MIRDFERLDIGDGTTVLLWSSGALMQRHFTNQKVFDRHKLHHARVLELGSGSGLLAMQLRAMGAQVTASDIEPDLTLLKKQIAKANADVRVVELLWGEKGWNQSVVKNEPSYDFVFCADLIAIDEAHEDLLWTLRKLIGKDTICFFGFKNRDDFSLNFFAMLHDTLEFDLEEELDVDRDNVEDGEEVLIYKITRKK